MAKKKAKKTTKKPMANSKGGQTIMAKMMRMNTQIPHPALWKGPNIGKGGVVQ